jgi:hypothetical protein
VLNHFDEPGHFIEQKPPAGMAVTEVLGVGVVEENGLRSTATVHQNVRRSFRAAALHGGVDESMWGKASFVRPLGLAL